MYFTLTNFPYAIISHTYFLNTEVGMLDTPSSTSPGGRDEEILEIAGV